VVFVGRITRQKGLPYLLRAAARLQPEVQLVLCAGAPDTPQMLTEVESLIAELQQHRTGVVWITEMLPRAEVIALLSAATVFACPSVYEPLGIVNLEAMACETAVVASDVGGIPEVVVDGETGLLVAPDDAAALAAAVARTSATSPRSATPGWPRPNLVQPTKATPAKSRAVPLTDDPLSGDIAEHSLSRAPCGLTV